MNVTDLYKDKLSTTDQNMLNRLAEKIAEGKMILFLGAAVHCTPPEGFEEFYPSCQRPPLGKELANILAEDFPELGEQKYSLSWIAQYYEGQIERYDLINQIRIALANKQPSPLVNALAEMNFRFILTTNYDNLYEQALAKAGKTDFKKGIYKPNRDNSVPPEVTEDFPFQSITPNEPFLYKIHGDINDVFENGAYKPKKDAIVITDEDYIHFILRMSERDPLNSRNFNPIPSSFTKALADPDDIRVLFIGYSLMDYNLRLLFKSSMWKKDVQAQLRKWSIDLHPDMSIKDLYKGLYTITFIEKDAWVVIPYLYQQIFKKEMPV